MSDKEQDLVKEIEQELKDNLTKNVFQDKEFSFWRYAKNKLPFILFSKKFWAFCVVSYFFTFGMFTQATWLKDFIWPYVVIVLAFFGVEYLSNVNLGFGIGQNSARTGGGIVTNIISRVKNRFGTDEDKTEDAKRDKEELKVGPDGEIKSDELP